MRSWPDLPPMTSVPLTEAVLAATDAVVLVTDHAAVDYALVAAGGAARRRHARRLSRGAPERGQGVSGVSGGDAFRGRLALVTGGAGFIGSHLVDALLASGAQVRVLDDLSSGSLENLAHVASRIAFVEGDIRDLETCRRACEGAAFVFHQAARGSVPRSMEDPATTIAINVAGTANVFAAARDARSRARRLRLVLERVRRLRDAPEARGRGGPPALAVRALEAR